MASDVRVAIPDPHYSLLDTSRGDMPAVVVVNDALLSFEHRDLFAWQLEITIEASEVGERGMPTRRETKVLDNLGDAIESVLARATTNLGSVNVLFLARVTCDSRRELVYRVHDPEAANRALAKAVVNHIDREWAYNLFCDDGWEAAQVFQDLYASAFD